MNQTQGMMRKMPTTDPFTLRRKKTIQMSLFTAKSNKNLPFTYQQELIERLEKIVREHLSERYSINSLATQVAMSNSSLYRFLKKMTGSGPGQFIRDIRLRETAFLLESRQYQTISEVVYAVGFVDASSFTRLFKKRFGKNPSTYLGFIQVKRVEKIRTRKIVHAFVPKIHSTDLRSS